MKKLFVFVTIVLCLSLLAAPALAEGILLVDDADLLSYDQMVEIMDVLETTRTKYNCEVAIAAVPSLGDKDPQTFADDYFDENGYGCGDDGDGILLVLSMEYRDYAITTTGKAINIFSDSDLDYIVNRILPQLGNGDYHGAFMTFARLCDEEIARSAPSTSDDFGLKIGISLGVGIFIAFIVVGVMRRALKSAVLQDAADNYIRQGSFNLTNQRDSFLYATVSKTRRADNNSGSSHSSSSGRSHGGSSGKF